MYVRIMIIVMQKCQKENNKMLKYNHGEKSMKHPFIIYGDLECLLQKMSICHNNPERSSTTKKYEHTPFGYSKFTHCSFDATKITQIVIEVKTVWKDFVRA